MSIFTDQKAFMTACGQMSTEGLNIETSLWGTLIREEVRELFTALQHFSTSSTLNAKANVAQEAIDVIYVVSGLLNNLNIPADKVWAAVHGANMEKLDPVTGQVRKREDGKILKPEGWKAPDIMSILLEHHHANHKS